ncbi:yippee zinc-binding/DNA-binding /Mis18, centromere assembly-domain-containing protein [Polychytrium aggregatum]|uniref:yippee zinc-binding/DNA-binding /Mis18, centromere assembly-domain-containing protein n=1 Tax=Polychytrium aggregatum TaxID=110093 RepID=UPI0022FEA01B|nr:yippee zinc-binding/DNA-binding /Mis18, centromere assembly-domain-containing protein [Polychytrium aggregatum]KAI9209737.1 yippee zinc-binding/DNA-binding /Mis18, centromere assembly-domain-containing protein [Polychytrium aggregatum]
MGIIFKRYLDPETSTSRIFGCTVCKTHLSSSDEIISKEFRGQHGKAYLFKTVINIYEGELSERSMTTGVHVVRDIYCVCCSSIIGWKYEKAYEGSQKYKEGLFIMERLLLTEL